MIHRLKADYDKLLLTLAALAVAASASWLAQQQGAARRLRAQPVAAVLAGTNYEPANLELPAIGTAVWPTPPLQSSGQGWLYEVFTPPAIYYNPLARTFTVAPPFPQGETGASFGLELVDVRQEKFRLQLAGYCGEPGDYLGIFVSPNLPETLLAREGRRFADLGLVLKSIAVEKIPVEHADTGPVYDVAARAVLADDRTGGEVVLDSRTRKFTGAPLAVLQLPTGGQPRELREGDTLADGNSTYRIERIQLDPPEAVVARTMPGLPQPEIKVLHPAVKAEEISIRAAKSKPLPDRPARELATNGR